MSSSLISIARWQEEVRTILPNLSRSQADGLGRLSYAVNILGHCGLTHICGLLSPLENRSLAAVRQQQREWYYEAEAKRGRKRREVAVAACFAPLLSWMLAHWQGEHRLALALDASQLGKRFVVLSISVLYRGCGVPVAWRLLRVGQKHGWNPVWEHLLSLLAPAVGADWKVVVMTDQGLYSPRLYRHIQSLGWHPLMRVRENIGTRAKGERTFQPGVARVSRAGRSWKGVGEWSEQGETMQGTIVIRHERGYEHTWVLVTDLEPGAVDAAWYQMRFWIEGEYKDHKRGGLHWEQTKMTDPQRAERLWLVMAIAMLRAVLLGGSLQAREQAQMDAKPHKRPGRSPTPHKRPGRPPTPSKRPRGRAQSCLARGQQAILVADLKGETLLPTEVVATPWPTRTFPLAAPTSCWREKQKDYAQRDRTAKHHQQERWQNAWPVLSPADLQASMAGSTRSEQPSASAKIVPVGLPSVQENPP